MVLGIRWEPHLFFDEGMSEDEDETDLASLVPVEGVTEEKTKTAVSFYQIEVDPEVAMEAGSGMLDRSLSL